MSTDAALVKLPVVCNLLALPDDCLLYILALLHESPTPASRSRLFGRSLDCAAESQSLASTCSRLRRLFRGSVVSLSIQWSDPIGSTVASLFAKGLRHLAVSQHAQAARFVQSVADGKTPLRTLNLAECRVDHEALGAAIRNMHNSLTVLALRYVEGPGMRMTLEAMSACTQLVDLTLHGMPDISHDNLVQVFSPQLRALSIGYLRHPTMSDETLRAIAKRCTNLLALELEDTRWASPMTIAETCISMSHSLCLLSLKSCSMSDRLLNMIFASSGRLGSVAVQDRRGARISASDLVQSCSILGVSLRSLDISGTPQLCDEHIVSLVAQAPYMRELRVANSPLVSDISVRAIATDLRATIEILDVLNCSISDSGLEFVGSVAPPRLRAIRFGGTCCWEDEATPVGLIGERPVVTNYGVEELLRGVGQSLRVFYFEIGSQNGQAAARPAYAGLSAEGMAKSLAAHCPLLQVVRIEGLLPRLRQRVLRARAELALIMLEEAAPRCELFVGKVASPAFVSVSWRDLATEMGLEGNFGGS
jgi:hypothetical protein